MVRTRATASLSEKDMELRRQVALARKAMRIHEAKRVRMRAEYVKRWEEKKKARYDSDWA